MIAPEEPTGAEIDSRQNSTPALRAQAACRKAYDLAKWWAAVSTCGALVLAFVSPLTVVVAPDASNFVAALGGLWLIGSRFALDPRRDTWQSAGATLQDEFDWLAIGVRTDSGLYQHVLPEQRARLLNGVDLEPYRDWYAPNSGDSWPAAPLRSQSQSASWSSRLHAIWTRVLTGVLLVSVSAQVVVCSIAGSTVPEYLGLVVLPSAAFYIAVLDSIRRHTLARRQRILVVTDTSAWFGIQDDSAGRELLGKNQIRLFELRSRGPLVPSPVYRLFRRRFERDMRDAAALGLP